MKPVAGGVRAEGAVVRAAWVTHVVASLAGLVKRRAVEIDPVCAEMRLRLSTGG